MVDMKKLNDKAYDWLDKKNAKQWSKSHFSTIACFDVLCNNLHESFNSTIMEVREQLILSMMESIRLEIMEKIFAKRLTVKKLSNEVVPCKNIQYIRQKSRCCPYVKWPSDLKYQVMTKKEFMTDINLGARTCNCKKWDLSGIPCMHVIACMLTRREYPYSYVSN